MKRGISILAVVALLVSLLAGCGGVRPSDADTWNSTRIAPYAYLVAFDATDAFERTFNRLYIRAVVRSAALADQLSREADGAAPIWTPRSGASRN